MNLLAFYVSVFLLLLVSCKNGSSLQNKTVPKTLQQTQKIFDTTKWEANTVDTFNYANLPYWNEKMDRFDSTYVDTFSVDGCMFRFVNPLTNIGKESSDAFVYLEKQNNNRWVFDGFTLIHGNYVRDFFHSEDVNGDGFIDITQNQQAVQAVYFFDTLTKQFLFDTLTGESDNYINPEWTLIDTVNKTFCDFQEFRRLSGQITSTLYTYDGFKKKELYELLLDNYQRDNLNSETDYTFIKKLILSKIFPLKHYDPITAAKDSLVLIQEIKLSKPIKVKYNFDSSYFDYAKFWESRYKKLLGYE